ncbi:hypothetical protein DB35_02935 [Streptomyces abyssalis]|uniref:DUF3566 domain-containing protein n=1 Tax=Streptomyces abyssalis TaxID=933944 RepID=A0A1E7JPN6_9ACTN|nr:DUF3566 domain-containing protein [Streptomyces abyssalis]OEU90252.1 hypothetical protein AN215_12060 [Streptomyces abyssalis]OEU94986.1 hypothetical protein DB35_02935 [Streptomyces abyssalis]
MSGAQPQPHAGQGAEARQQPQPESQPLPDAQPHRPPQAYPAPPVTPPTTGVAGPGSAGGGHGQQPRTDGAGAGTGAGAGAGMGTGTGTTTEAGAGAGVGLAAGAVRRPRTGARTVPRTRKARLRVAKADPWSVMKVSFLLSIALGVCTIVAVAVLWMVMNAMGVFSAISGTVSQATESGAAGGGFDLESFLSLPRVLLFTTVIAVIDVVLATALATLGAFIYNLSAGFVGGVELTLAEDE